MAEDKRVNKGASSFGWFTAGVLLVALVSAALVIGATKFLGFRIVSGEAISPDEFEKIVAAQEEAWIEEGYEADKAHCLAVKRLYRQTELYGTLTKPFIEDLSECVLESPVLRAQAPAGDGAAAPVVQEPFCVAESSVTGAVPEKELVETCRTREKILRYCFIDQIGKQAVVEFDVDQTGAASNLSVSGESIVLAQMACFMEAFENLVFVPFTGAEKTHIAIRLNGNNLPAIEPKPTTEAVAVEAKTSEAVTEKNSRRKSNQEVKAKGSSDEELNRLLDLAGAGTNKKQNTQDDAIKNLVDTANDHAVQNLLDASH